MRKLILLTAVAALTLTSCLQDELNKRNNLDLTFSFNTRNDISVEIKAVNEVGEAAPGVLFSIYASNPFGDEGVRIVSVRPIYQGYTTGNGSSAVKVPVPYSTKELFIVPEYAGFGSMQVLDITTSSSQSVVLEGIRLKSEVSTKAGDGVAERDRINCGNNYKFYRYFTNDEYDPNTGAFVQGALVSTETLSTEFKAMVNDWFPEGGFATDGNFSTDLLIKDDNTQVWVTYIGDGGFSISSKNELNSLMYYTYTQEPTSYYSKDDCINGRLQLTYAIINGHPEFTPCGTKVQLLYWNGSKYVPDFPAGTHIGFLLQMDGYGTLNGTRNFSLNEGKARFSTSGLNRDGKAHGIAYWSEKFSCYVLGMENQFTADADFNDMLIKVSTSKPTTLSTMLPAPSEDEVEVPKNTYCGTLAFEDLWPYKGDYDFNDFVTDYKYELFKSGGTNDITSVKMTFTPKALGATHSSAFAIQLPISASNVASVSGAVLESNSGLATIIVLPNVRNAFNGTTGILNTFKKLPHVASTPVEVIINFSSPIGESNMPFRSFNPFIYRVDVRGAEVHLVDYAPTEMANKSMFGTGDDRSVPSQGVYYRMDNVYPWAIDVASDGVTTWRYPIENAIITSAYLKYNNWVSNKSDLSWFDWTQAGNADVALLY